MGDKNDYDSIDGDDGEGSWHRNIKESARRVEDALSERRPKKADQDKLQYFLDDNSSVMPSTPIVPGISIPKGASSIFSASVLYGVGISLATGGLGVIFGLAGAAVGIFAGNLFDSVTLTDYGMISLDDLQDTVQRDNEEKN